MQYRRGFLPFTKYQTALWDENLVSKGSGEGVVRTSKRFQSLYGDKDHYAMGKDGDVAFEKGDVYEKKRTPTAVNHV